jgi:signal transduction histidine kinase
MDGSKQYKLARGVRTPVTWPMPVAWLLTALVLSVLLLVAIPPRFAELAVPCTQPPCEAARLSPQGHFILRQLGFPPAAYAAYSLATEVLVSLAFVAISALIIRRQSANRFALFAAFMLILFGIGVSETVNVLGLASPTIRSILRLLNAAGFVMFFVAWYLFPDGRLYPSWTKFLVPLWIALEVPWAFPDLIHLPPWLAIPLTLGLIASCLLAQLVRYRHPSTPAQRQQTKWVLFGLLLTVSGFVAYGLLPIVLPGLVEPGVREVVYYGFGRTVVGASLLMLPLTLGIAIWRYRLWDIDLILNRTAVYFVLVSAIIAIYALIVGSLGALFQTRGNWFISLVAAGAVTILFQPLRLRIQRVVNRMMFGDRDEPVTVLTRLARTLEDTGVPGQLLSNIERTITQALRLPSAVISLSDEDEVSRGLALDSSQRNVANFPLVYQSKVLGYLAVTPREPGEPLSPADQNLLADIARQAGPAIYALKLTADLQRSRERLVVGREEERRRIRRDLHDGLGPMLASHSLLLESLEKLIHRDTVGAALVISELKRQTQTSLVDVRQLIYNLRPPSLDDLGIVGALQEEINRRRGPDLQISIHSEALPPLPAAAEVAIFRIVQEAVTNVVRHAAASSCEVVLYVEDGAGQARFVAEIRDDGHGFPPEHQAGVGLESMLERAAELGGVCLVESAAGKGTTVRAWVPLNEEG